MGDLSFIPGSLVSLVLLSLFGAAFGHVACAIPGIDRLGTLTLIFLLQIVVGFSPDEFVIFAVAGFTAVTMVNRQTDPMIAQIIALKWLHIILVITALLSAVFWQEIAELIIQAKAAGMIHLLAAVLLANLFLSRHDTTKSLLALSLGMLIAYFDSFFSLKAIGLPWDLAGWYEGGNVLTVLTGTCLFAPMLGGVAKEVSLVDGRKTKLPFLELSAMAALLAFGIGITIPSIILFALLNYESVALGPLVSLESQAAVRSPLIAILIALVFSFAVIKSNPKRFATSSLWLAQASVIIISVAAILVSGLGIVSVFLVLFFAAFAHLLRNNDVPVSLFMAGFIYGQQMEYFLNIARLTEQSLLAPPGFVVVITVLLVSILKFQLLRKQ